MDNINGKYSIKLILSLFGVLVQFATVVHCVHWGVTLSPQKHHTLFSAKPPP